MKWLDAEDIALALVEKYPAVDPLSVRFTDLRDKVLQLQGFDDDVKLNHNEWTVGILRAWRQMNLV